jgi:hypothetical protein
MNAASTHPATGAVDIALFLAPRTVDAGATAPAFWRAARERIRAYAFLQPAATVAAVMAAIALSSAGMFGVAPAADAVAPEHPSASRPERGDQRMLPLHAGTPVVLDRWEITTGAVEWKADDRVLRVNAFPIVPERGWHWALLDVSVLNLSAEDASASLIDVTLVTGDVEVSSSDAARQVPAQAIPDELDAIDVPARGSRRGNLGFLVPASAEGLCALRIDLRTAGSATPVDSVWVACGEAAVVAPRAS